MAQVESGFRRNDASDAKGRSGGPCVRFADDKRGTPPHILGRPDPGTNLASGGPTQGG